MFVAKHRVNSIAELKNLEKGVSAEIDIRTYDKEIVLNHEPFAQGDRFRDYLQTYATDRTAPLILNVKEDGLEKDLIRICEERNILNYFILDCAPATLVRLARQGFKKASVRVSDYEPIATAQALKGLLQWCWIDCFKEAPADPSLVREIQDLGYRICLVSPELQGHSAEALNKHIQTLKPLLRPGKDGVCTKQPAAWFKT